MMPRALKSKSLKKKYFRKLKSGKTIFVSKSEFSDLAFNTEIEFMQFYSKSNGTVVATVEKSLMWWLVKLVPLKNN